jgi:tetratricopeptide (TPR) repeat protein
VAAVFVRADGSRLPAIDLTERERAAPEEGVDPPPLGGSIVDWFDPRPGPDAEPDRRLGDFYFAVGGLPRLARERYLAAVACQGLDPKLRLRVGQVEIELGDLQRARRWVDSALDIRPRYAAALATDGLLRLATGDASGAADAFSRAMARDDSHPDYPTGLGGAREEEGRFEEAVEAYLRALDIDPDWPPARLGVGRSLRRGGHLVRARQRLQETLARTRGPGRAALHHELGLLERDAGRIDAARQHLRRAITLAPDEPDFLQALESLRDGGSR